MKVALVRTSVIHRRLFRRTILETEMLRQSTLALLKNITFRGHCIALLIPEMSSYLSTGPSSLELGEVLLRGLVIGLLEHLSQKLNVLGHSVLLAHASNLLPGVVLGLADKVEHARSRTGNVTLVSLLEVGVESELVILSRLDGPVLGETLDDGYGLIELSLGVDHCEYVLMKMQIGVGAGVGISGRGRKGKRREELDVIECGGASARTLGNNPPDRWGIYYGIQVQQA